jgi:hypothetical protein
MSDCELRRDERGPTFLAALAVTQRKRLLDL